MQPRKSVTTTPEIWWVSPWRPNQNFVTDNPKQKLHETTSNVYATKTVTYFSDGYSLMWDVFVDVYGFLRAMRPFRCSFSSDEVSIPFAQKSVLLNLPKTPSVRFLWQVVQRCLMPSKLPQIRFLLIMTSPFRPWCNILNITLFTCNRFELLSYRWIK